jgi:hypothetical protein
LATGQTICTGRVDLEVPRNADLDLPEVAPVEMIPGLLIEQARAALIPNRLLASL